MLARKRHIKREKHKRQKQKHKTKKSAHLSLVPTQKKSSANKHSSTSNIACLLQPVLQLSALVSTVATAAANEVTLRDPAGRIYDVLCEPSCDWLIDKVVQEKRFVVDDIVANLTNLPQQLVADYNCDESIHITQNGTNSLNFYGDYLHSLLSEDVQNSCKEANTALFILLIVLSIKAVLGIGGFIGWGIYRCCNGSCGSCDYCNRLHGYEPIPSIPQSDPAISSASQSERSVSIEVKSNYQAAATTASTITEVKGDNTNTRVTP